MLLIYRVRINYRRISLRHNLSTKCREIVKFVSITHRERNIRNGPIVATVISRKKRQPDLEGNGCLTDRA
jgi:SH3-like domain-containing protein